MKSEYPRLSPTAKWVAIMTTTLAAAACLSPLTRIGTTNATIQAIVCATLPLAAWWDARRLRRAGHPEAADTLVLAAMVTMVMLMGSAFYTANLAEQVELCTGYPPR